MKKILLILLYLIIIMSVTGCSNNNTGKIVENTPFYSLQAAYNKDILTRRDLKAINKLLYKEKTVELDDKIYNKIIDDYKAVYPKYEGTNIIINEYLGTYGNAVVIMIRSESQLFQDVLSNETIAGISFNYNNSQKILVWIGEKLIYE